MPCVTSGAPLHPSLRSHGDMLYMEQRVPVSLAAQGVAVLPGVKEDEVDQVLSKKDGKIHRPKDPHLWVQALHSLVTADHALVLGGVTACSHAHCRCHHGDNNKCLNCAPLEVRWSGPRHMS